MGNRKNSKAWKQAQKSKRRPPLSVRQDPVPVRRARTPVRKVRVRFEEWQAARGPPASSSAPRPPRVPAEESLGECLFSTVATPPPPSPDPEPPDPAVSAVGSLFFPPVVPHGHVVSREDAVVTRLRSALATFVPVWDHVGVARLLCLQGFRSLVSLAFDSAVAARAFEDDARPISTLYHAQLLRSIDRHVLVDLPGPPGSSRAHAPNIRVTPVVPEISPSDCSPAVFVSPGSFDAVASIPEAIPARLSPAEKFNVPASSRPASAASPSPLEEPTVPMEGLDSSASPPPPPAAPSPVPAAVTGESPAASTSVPAPVAEAVLPSPVVTSPAVSSPHPSEPCPSSAAAPSLDLMAGVIAMDTSAGHLATPQSPLSPATGTPPEVPSPLCDVSNLLSPLLSPSFVVPRLFTGFSQFHTPDFIIKFPPSAVTSTVSSGLVGTSAHPPFPLSVPAIPSPPLSLPSPMASIPPVSSSAETSTPPPPPPPPPPAQPPPSAHVPPPSPPDSPLGPAPDLPDPSSGGARPWTELFSSVNQSFALHEHPASGEEVAIEPEDTSSKAGHWMEYLAGFFCGKRPPLGAIKSHLAKVWLGVHFTIHPVHTGAIVLKFKSVDVAQQILQRAPPSIHGHMLILKPWHPSMSLKMEDLKTIPIWVNLPFLHPLLKSIDSLSKIASFIGKPLFTDKMSLDGSRLEIARVCVEVTADSVLPEVLKIRYDGTPFMQPIHYYWKPSPCKMCKIFNHSTASCPVHGPQEKGKGVWVQKDADPSDPPSDDSLHQSADPPADESATFSIANNQGSPPRRRLNSEIHIPTPGSSSGVKAPNLSSNIFFALADLEGNNFTSDADAANFTMEIEKQGPSEAAAAGTSTAMGIGDAHPSPVPK